MESDYPLLSKINSPTDLKNLGMEELNILSGEVRRRIIEVLSSTGGHLASNLGVVELSIALHYIFDSPKDAIVWDVGHQCYTHKILTGRNDQFPTIRQKNGLSGFPKRCESEHDVFETGHSSTSISAGLGLLMAKKIKKETGKVVAVIGDGAFTGGMALEALNHTGHMGKDLVIILNDNNMSISKNVGAISSYLSRITATTFYQKIRNTIDDTVRRIPYIGRGLLGKIIRMKKAIKAMFFKETLFSDLGFEYIGPIDGHNIHLLLKVLHNVKEIEKPVVVHTITQKGRGYKEAEGDPATYHGVSPNMPNKAVKKSKLPSFTSVFSDVMVKKAETDASLVAITAAMEKGTGLDKFHNKYPDRFYDVGITEQHAVTFAGGLAAGGLKPVVALYSTFMQRAVDQIIHDVALPGLPVIFAVDRAGLVGPDGETHQGVFDVPLFRSVPNLEILSPGSREEMNMMFDYAFSAKGPVLIRYPKASCPKVPKLENQPLVWGKGAFYSKHTNSSILIISGGTTLAETAWASENLDREGYPTDVYNLRFLKPVDEAYLTEIIAGYSHVFSFEDTSSEGGMGQYIASVIQKYGINVDYRYFAVPDHFITHANRDELLADCMVGKQSITQTVLKTITQNRSFKVLNSYYG